MRRLQSAVMASASPSRDSAVSQQVSVDDSQFRLRAGLVLIFTQRQPLRPCGNLNCGTRQVSRSRKPQSRQLTNPHIVSWYHECRARFASLFRTSSMLVSSRLPRRAVTGNTATRMAQPSYYRASQARMPITTRKRKSGAQSPQLRRKTNEKHN